jgi:hypothetical protein
MSTTSTQYASDATLAELELVYVDRVNQAVADDRFDVVDALAAEFDAEVARLHAA